jgi:hypothetical protein
MTEHLERVTVVADKYGRYTGLSGDVVGCPPELLRYDTPDLIWVRLDGTDDRVPAVGFYPDEIRDADDGDLIAEAKDRGYFPGMDSPKLRA